MITYSGIHIQKIGGADGTPTPLDIAVHAGRLCRFGGAVWYPLLPHLVFVGLLAYRRSGKLSSVRNMMWGFLHDAHECVTGDIPRPFKCNCMRTEQEAIDERLLAEYFDEDDRYAINFELIKKCDIDACDIEATSLGVKNYEAITTAAAVNGDHVYHHQLHKNTDDQQLFNRILESPFYGATNYDGCIGVSAFTRMLEKAKAGEWNEVICNVESWGLI
jgi:hypothetical protein